MKPLKDIGRTYMKDISTLNNFAEVRVHEYHDEERRELVREVWEAARSVSGNTTNYYTHGDDVDEFLKSEGL